MASSSRILSFDTTQTVYRKKKFEEEHGHKSSKVIS
jgi:hypothetical protein